MYRLANLGLNRILSTCSLSRVFIERFANLEARFLERLLCLAIYFNPAAYLLSSAAAPTAPTFWNA